MVFFSPASERDVKRLPIVAREELRAEYLPVLSANPRSGKMLHGPLRGYFSYDFRSAGVSYRIAYELISGDIVILMIDTRDNFYKKFSRRV
jgi:mRNA-degrading endonuclease RelE of RelBE toxin-antitoxin system